MEPKRVSRAGNLMRRALRRATDESGATAIEYALIAGLIAVALITTLTDVGTNVDALFGAVNEAVEDAIPAAP
jgi:pilus assembly protein Flp/PilA